VNSGDLLVLATIAVAILAILATVWATRKWGNRRGLLEFSWDAVPLLPGQQVNGLLQVTFRDIAVSEPHLVTVILRNVGPRDVPSSAFDGGLPLRVTFDQTFYGLTSSHGGRVSSPAIGTQVPHSNVEWSPNLLKRQEQWVFSAVVSGSVLAELESPLVDTDVREVVRGERLSATASLSLAGITLAMPISFPWSSSRS
jgi:hypothetical protein